MRVYTISHNFSSDEGFKGFWTKCGSFKRGKSLVVMMVCEGWNGFRMSPNGNFWTKIMVAKKRSSDEGSRGVLDEMWKLLDEMWKDLDEMWKDGLKTRIKSKFFPVKY